MSDSIPDTPHDSLASDGQMVGIPPTPSTPLPFDDDGILLDTPERRAAILPQEAEEDIPVEGSDTTREGSTTQSLADSLPLPWLVGQDHKEHVARSRHDGTPEAPAQPWESVTSLPVHDDSMMETEKKEYADWYSPRLLRSGLLSDDHTAATPPKPTDSSDLLVEIGAEAETAGHPIWRKVIGGGGHPRTSLGTRIKARWPGQRYGWSCVGLPGRQTSPTWVMYGGQAGKNRKTDAETWELDVSASQAEMWRDLGATGPGNRVGHALVSCGGALWVCGGESIKDDNPELTCDLWRMEDGGWMAIAPTGGWVPSPRARHGVAAVEDRLVVFGGWGVVDEEKRKAKEERKTEKDDLALLGDTWIFDPSLGEWVCFDDLDPHPSPRCGHNLTLVASHGGVWLFGGRREGDIVCNDLWVWDPVTSAWTQLPCGGDLWPCARWLHAAVEADDCLLVFGGQDVNGTPLSDVWVYNPALGVWRLVWDGSVPPSIRQSPANSTVPIPRMMPAAAAAVAHGGCTIVAVAGGVTERGAALSDVWVLAVPEGCLSEQWAMFPPPPAEDTDGEPVWHGVCDPVRREPGTARREVRGMFPLAVWHREQMQHSIGFRRPETPRKTPRARPRTAVPRSSPRPAAAPTPPPPPEAARRRPTAQLRGIVEKVVARNLHQQFDRVTAVIESLGERVDAMERQLSRHKAPARAPVPVPARKPAAPRLAGHDDDATRLSQRRTEIDSALVRLEHGMEALGDDLRRSTLETSGVDRPAAPGGLTIADL